MSYTNMLRGTTLLTSTYFRNLHYVAVCHRGGVDGVMSVHFDRSRSLVASYCSTSQMLGADHQFAHPLAPMVSTGLPHNLYSYSFPSQAIAGNYISYLKLLPVQYLTYPRAPPAPSYLHTDITDCGRTTKSQFLLRKMGCIGVQLSLRWDGLAWICLAKVFLCL
jgi:hypothetical protein